jgi:fucose permease
MPRAKALLLICISVSLTFFLGYESGAFQLVLLRVSEHLEVRQSLMGSLVAVQFFAIVIGPILFGRIADRIGKKRVLQITVPIFFFGCFIAASASGIQLFIFGIFIVGIGFSACEITVSAMLVDEFDNNANRLMNLSQSGFSFGAVTGPILTNWLIGDAGLGWPIAFIVPAVGFISIYPFIFFINHRKRKPVNMKSASTGEIGINKRWILNRYYIVLIFAMFTYVGIENGIAFFIDSMFVIEFEKGNFSAYAISVFWLSMAVSRILCYIKEIFPRYNIVFFFFACVPLLIFFSQIKNFYLTMILIAVSGFLAGPVWSSIVNRGAILYRNNTGVATGVILMGGGLGGAIIPLWMGLLSGIGGMSNSFFLLAGLAVVAAVVVLHEVMIGDSQADRL